jgi:hypothetical protein
MFTIENCCKAFEASGLVPINAQVVLDCLEVRLHTPPESLLSETLWQLKTLSNTHGFGSQSKLVRESFTRLPVTAQTGFSQLMKGAELMLHQNALPAARNHEFEEQLAVMTKRKSRKRKRLQHGVPWSMVRQLIKWLPARCWWLIHQRRHTVVVLQKQHYLLRVAVVSVGRLGTMQEHARKMQLSLLIQCKRLDLCCPQWILSDVRYYSASSPGPIRS